MFLNLFFRYVGAGGLTALLVELILTIYVIVITAIDVYRMIRKTKE